MNRRRTTQGNGMGNEIDAHARRAPKARRAGFSRRKFIALGAAATSSCWCPPAIVHSRNRTDAITIPERITDASAVTQAFLIRTRQITPLELAEGVINRIRRVDEQIGAVEHLAEQAALDQAERATEALVRGKVDFERQRLFGVLCGVKDTLDVEGMPTTGGAPALADRIAPADATVVRRLKREGAIPVVKTRMPLFGMGYESINSFGQVNNPHDLSRTAGGSSGGAAALSAAGGTPFDIGTDGGGSIRYPSHCCGVAGLVPAFGRVSVKGTYPPFENSEKLWYLAVGPIARRVEDLALVYHIIAGVDPHDPFTWPLPKGDHRKVDIRNLRIGYWTQPSHTQPTAETVKMVEDGAEALRGRGAKVRRIPCPFDLNEAREIIFSHLVQEMENFLDETVPQLGADADPLMADMRKLPGQFRAEHSKEDIAELQLKLPALREQVSASMAGLDAVLCPVKASPALPHFTFAEGVFNNVEGIPYTDIYGLVHPLPSGSVRCSTSREDLPLGMHVVGRPAGEAQVLAVLEALERDFEGWRPSVLFR